MARTKTLNRVGVLPFVDGLFCCFAILNFFVLTVVYKEYFKIQKPQKGVLGIVSNSFC